MTSFQALTSITPINSLNSFYQLGQCRRHFVKVRDEEESLDSEIRSQYLTLCVYEVTSLISHIEIRNFAEKREKKGGKTITHHSQQCNLLFHQRSYQPRICPLKSTMNNN